MSREAHVRFWEGAGVRFPRATRLPEGLPDGRGGRGIDWTLLRVLQPAALTSKPRLSNSGRGPYCAALISGGSLCC